MTPDEREPGPAALEADLRAALHRTSAPSHGADELLRTVHRRASRRRARRRIAGATLVIAGVAGAGTIATTWPHQTVTSAGTQEPPATSYVATSTPSAPAATDRSGATAPTITSGPASSPATTPSTRSTPQPGEPVEPADITVESVTAVQRASFWVMGTGRCRHGTCNVIAHTDDAGETFHFRTAPDPTPPAPTAPSTVPSTKPPPAELPGPAAPDADLRYAFNGTDAWGYGADVWSTHDAGRTWTPVELPVPATVSSVQAQGDQVWVFGTATGDGSPVVFSSPVGDDRWTAVQPGLASTDVMAVPVVTDGVVGALVTPAEGSQQFVRSRDDGATWERLDPPAGCDAPLASSGVAGAMWLYCSSLDAAAVAVSTDGGTSWRQQAVALPSSALSTMTGIDAMHALVTDAATLSIVTVGVDGSGGVEPVEGPYTADDQAWSGFGYTYAGFTDPLTGYLITTGGELARSDDGGQDWSRVHLP